MESSDTQQCTYHLQLLSTQKRLSIHSTKCCLPAITPDPCSHNTAAPPTLVTCTCLRDLEMFCSLTATYLKEFISEHGLLLILFWRFSLIHSSSGLSWSQHWGIIFHHCVLTISVVALTTMYPRKHTFTYLLQPALSPLKIWTISVLFTCVRPRRRTIPASRRLSVIYADSCTDLAPHQHGHGLRLIKQSGISYLKQWFY